MKERIKISVIVPFFKGNQYLNRLLDSVERVAVAVKDTASITVDIMNDSPGYPVEIPQIKYDHLAIYVWENPHNMGIQRTRVRGLQQAKGEFVVFLDQDDELVSEGFEAQVRCLPNADVVVGNALYQFGSEKKRIYSNGDVMRYLIQKDIFVAIRNQIPSPGQCLIRKSVIPQYWMDHFLSRNGADDWLLWILLFQESRRFVCNEQVVYIHNDAEGNNLSYDLDKMKASCDEMYELLTKYSAISDCELRRLRAAIDFKYLQDTGRLMVRDCLKYSKTIWDNICYKGNVLLKGRSKR